MKLKDWLMFGALGSIWGSSFLWIKVAVQDVDPLILVGWRLLFGSLGLLIVVFATRPKLPHSWRSWALLAVLGLTNTALPFVLISWGEQTIDSAVASILNSTVPLFTLILAHLFLHDDRLSLPKAVGLLTGFAGVMVLAARDLEPGGLGASLLGQVAVLVAAVSYASSSVLARRTMREVSPIVQACATVVAADAVVWLVASGGVHARWAPSTALAWLALLWLGLLGSCTAYLLYYRLIHSVGATRSTMVTYIFPVVGVALGVLFLGERADWHLLAGAALVLSGIGVVNGLGARTMPAPEAVPSQGRSA
jgi:drug/metabolite transporter (DMT)-like permease